MKGLGRSFNKFLLLWFGEFISAIGSGLTAFLPSFLFAPIAGVFADRYDRRLLMVLGDSLSAVGLMVILVFMMFGEANTWQVCLGVSISSIFSSLLEPSYKATVTDLLSQEEYTKASGLVQVAGSAKYLISPILAGILLSLSDIKLLIWIDICTFFVTVTATLVVRSGLVSKQHKKDETFKVLYKHFQPQ